MRLGRDALRGAIPETGLWAPFVLARRGATGRDGVRQRAEATSGRRGRLGRRCIPVRLQAIFSACRSVVRRPSRMLSGVAYHDIDGRRKWVRERPWNTHERSPFLSASASRTTRSATSPIRGAARVRVSAPVTSSCSGVMPTTTTSGTSAATSTRSSRAPRRGTASAATSTRRFREAPSCAAGPTTSA